MLPFFFPYFLKYFFLQQKPYNENNFLRIILSVILPAFNEEKRLPKTLSLVNDFFVTQGIEVEIIIVNDGSTDGTQSIGEEFAKGKNDILCLSLEKNQGKGSAIAAGVARASGEWILITDADNATPIEEFQKLSEKKDAQTVVIGSRYLSTKGTVREQPAGRFLLGKLANALIRILVLPGISDTQCGFKLFPAKAAKEIFAQQRISRFAFDVEALLVAQNFGYHIQEVPVSWFHQNESRIRPVRDICKTLWDLLQILGNKKKGLYYRPPQDMNRAAV